MLANYAHPTGDTRVPPGAGRACSAREYGWRVTRGQHRADGRQPVGILPAVQSVRGPGRGRRRRILLPVTPEYVGYADVGLVDDFFVSARPALEELPDGLFKYHPDFDRLRVGADVGALCVSRPTNPTGNVLTDAEMAQLDELARRHGVPFILDSAYGPPFPDIVFTEARSRSGTTTSSSA